jgi:hypothetical protein
MTCYKFLLLGWPHLQVFLGQAKPVEHNHFLIKKCLLPQSNYTKAFHCGISNMYILYFDKKSPLLYYSFLTTFSPPPPFQQFLVGFILLFSHMYIMYFYNIHHPSPSPVLLLQPTGSQLPKNPFTIMSYYFFKSRLYIHSHVDSILFTLKFVLFSVKLYYTFKTTYYS